MDIIDAELGPDPLRLTSARGAHDIPWRLSFEGVRLNGSNGMAGEIKPMLRLPLRRWDLSSFVAWHRDRIREQRRNGSLACS